MPFNKLCFRKLIFLATLSFFYLAGLGQDRVVSGKVLDKDNNMPVSGVSIQVKNSNVGVTSDSNGDFSIRARLGSTLIVSSTGFGTLEYAPGRANTVIIRIGRLIDALQDVVVVGYGTQRKRDITGAVASVGTRDFASLPAPDAGQAVEGKAAGVQVIASGPPGNNVTFRVRGTGTINDADPLIVVDGVPADAPLNNINPDDIASFDVLKDASASAIYGSRGANGVILITTKRGHAGQGRLALNLMSGRQQAAKVVKMLDAAQFAALNNEMLSNGDQAVNPAFGNPDTLGVGTDWIGALFRTAPMQKYTVSYSGGTAKDDYYVSASMFDQQGIVQNTAYKRYTIQFNNEARVLPWLKFGNNLALTADDKPGMGANGATSYDIRNTLASNPIQPIYNKDGSYSNVLGNPLWYGDITNQIGTAHINQNDTKSYDVLGSLYAEVTLVPGLTFKTTGGLQAQFYNNRSWAPVYNFEPNPQTQSYLSQQSNTDLTYLWDNYLTYDHLFGSDHHLTVLAGTSAQNNRYNYISGNIVNFPSSVTQQLNSGTGAANVGGDGSEWALLSFMGRVNYSYKDKYLVTATVRRDRSSRFGPDNKYGTFPSASVAWRISRESFFKHVSFINDLKLRAGYGVTGNQNIGNYSFASNLNIAQYNFNNNIVSIVYPLVLPNPDVQWEQVEQGNIGVDAALFRSRLTVTVDAYIKNTSKMLVPAVVPVTTGYSSTTVPSVNAATMQNKGIELTIGSRNLVGAFTWNTDFNISFNANRITSLNDSTPLYVDNYGLNANFGVDQKGHPANEFYGYVADGLFQTQEDVAAHAVQQVGTKSSNSTSPGDIRFKDLNNDGLINSGDMTYIGNPNPKFVFGMGNSFTYKGADLNIFLQGVDGNKIFNANNIYQESMSTGENETVRTLRRWEGAGTGNFMPRAVYGDPNQNSRISTRYIEDGSYLRIKNVTLGYTFPGRLAQSMRFSSIRVYVSCSNVYTFTHYSGFDPEVGVNGVDYSVYPVTRILSAGINLNL
ncbi:MAG TPA: TonB-dependent receptor [Puia sp.]|nr:TonB-dependent receptor [Puia sp.]